MLNEEMLWVYRAVFKQTGAGGGIIEINVKANERTELLYGLIGPNDYAADRTVEAHLEDDAGNKFANVLFPSPVDNEELPISVKSGAAAVVDGTTADFDNIITLGNGWRLTITAATLVQNEEVTLALVGMFSSFEPSVTTTGSTGTVTTTTTYSKVV